MNKLLLAIVCAFLTNANAATGEVGVTYTSDSDKFNSQHIWTGAVASNGIGIRAGTVRYTSPNIVATGNTLQTTYTNNTDHSRTTGAVGIKTISYSGTNKDYLYGNAEFEYDVTKQLTIGVTVDKDLVESNASIQNKVDYLILGVNGSYQLNDEVTVTAGISNTQFSDNNNRLRLNTKVVWTVVPEYGISTYARIAYQADSNGGSKNYVSPENANTLAVGVQMRKKYAGLMFTAAAETGQVDEQFKFGQVGSEQYLFRLGVQTITKNKLTYGVSIIDLHKNNTDKYQWTGIYSWLRIDF